MSYKDYSWRELISIHQQLKQVLIFGEELGPDFNALLQPINEQRHALDHIIRAQSASIGIDGREDPEEYAIGQMGKAISHLYRAFFDAADWSGLLLREKIDNLLASYSNNTLVAVLPEYYKSYMPRMIQANKEIAEIRGAKDISKTFKEMNEEVNKYYLVLNSLQDIYEKVINAIPSLEAYKFKYKYSIIDVIDRAIYLREQIENLLAPYSTHIIESALPNYYQQYMPMMLKVNREIEGLRIAIDNGEITKENKEVIKKYNSVIKDFQDIYEEVIDAIPKLETFKSQPTLDVLNRAVLIHNKIEKLLQPYSNRTLEAVMPEYYKQYKPIMFEANRKITEIRNASRTAENDQERGQEEDKCASILNDLQDIYEKVSYAIPGMEDHKSKHQESIFSNRTFQIFAGVLCAGIGALIAYLLK